jgi:1-acyl-sn-glycerol-3-phosphate acyltransferase
MEIRSDMLYRLTRTVGRVWAMGSFRLQVEGTEHLPGDSAFVLLPKHQRWEDIPLLAIATPRPLYYVGKYELFRRPLMRWFLRAAGGIPLNRNRPMESRRYLREMLALLRKGEGVVVFPEGTYYRDRMGPGNIGLVRLILSRLSLPFVPVGMRYEGGGRRIGVRVRFGPSFLGREAGSAEDLLDRTMEEIARLSGLDDRGQA